MTYPNIVTFEDTAYDAACANRLQKNAGAAHFKREPDVKHQPSAVSVPGERRRPLGATASAPFGSNGDGAAPGLARDAVMASLDAKCLKLSPTTRLVAHAVAQLLLQQALPECARWAMRRDEEAGMPPLTAHSGVRRRQAARRRKDQVASAAERRRASRARRRALRPCAAP